MHFLTALLVVLVSFCSAIGVSQSPTKQGLYAHRNRVAAALIHGGSLLESTQIKISASYRQKPGILEHDVDTSIFYVADGEATLVTGSDTHHLSTGDVVVIPAGVPFWFKEVPRSISYHVIQITLPAGGAGSSATYLEHDKVADALANKRPMFTAPKLALSGGYRTGPDRPDNYNPAVEVHAKSADIFYVIDGAATLVTGGTVIGGKETGPDQTRGTEIKGGKAQPLVKGDVMLVPSGTPHWFTDYPKPFGYFRYFLIKVTD